MAFKMKGNPMDFVRSQKLKGNKVLKGEHPNTFANQRGGDSEAINDLEDRIEFLESDISNSDNPTQDQKASLRALKAKLKKMRA